MKQTSAIRYTPYAKNMLRIAVCDVLELAGCHDYWEGRQDGAEIVTASVEVLDHQSEFFFHIQEWCLGSLLTVTITRPSSGLSRAGEQRSVNNLTDRVLQFVENTIEVRPLRQREAVRRPPRKREYKSALRALLGEKARLRGYGGRPGETKPVTSVREESKQ